MLAGEIAASFVRIGLSSARAHPMATKAARSR